MASSNPSRAKVYSRTKYTLAIAGMIYSLCILIFFISSGLSVLLAAKAAFFTRINFLSIAIYSCFFSIIYFLLELPLGFYSGYIVEHRFNLSNQTIGDFFKDQLKSFIVSLIIFLILIEAFYFIVERFPLVWWLVISIAWILFSLVFAELTPILIIPLFFKYKPIQDEDLKSKIIKLALSAGIKILDVFEIDFSKKTSKANAAMTGLGRSKRVLLADTLKDKYTTDEIMVILAHEFSHYKLRHILKLIIINSIFTLALAYGLFIFSKEILMFFGFKSVLDIAAMPVVFIVIMLFSLIIGPFGNFVSRVFERQADSMALGLTGLKDAFISTMDKLANQNLSDRSPHPLIKLLFFDHPPIDERIRMAENFNINKD